MLIPVGVLAVLATIGGLVVIPGVWEPFLHWIDDGQSRSCTQRSRRTTGRVRSP